MPLAPGMKDKLIRRDEVDLPNRKANEYNIRQYLLRYFKDMEEISWLLDTLPENQVNKILRDGNIANSAMKLTEKILGKMDLPRVRMKPIRPGERKNALEAVKSFNLGPFNKKYLLKDDNGENEISTLGYSFIRDITTEEEKIIYNVSWFIDDLSRLLLPNRVTLSDCTLENFLNTVIPPLIDDAKKKGVLHQVLLDQLGTFDSLDNMACIARQGKAEEPPA
jgi:hypothetical protein